jgi:hypothetical protein
MLITITGPLPSGSNFFDFAFDVGRGDADNIELFNRSASELGFVNLFTNATVTFQG